MNFSKRFDWFAVGGHAILKDDVTGFRSQQELVKDEVSFPADSLDPVSQILAASEKLLASTGGSEAKHAQHNENMIAPNARYLPSN